MSMLRMIVDAFKPRTVKSDIIVPEQVIVPEEHKHNWKRDLDYFKIIHMDKDNGEKIAFPMMTSEHKYICECGATMLDQVCHLI